MALYPKILYLIKTDSLIIPIEYNLLSVLSFDKIEKIFKEINNTLYNNFKSFEAENKHCVLFDFELVATPVGNQLVLIQSMGEINSLKSANAGIDPFHTDDYWHVGYTDYHHDNMGITKPGKCGAYEGSLLGHDHTTRLEWSVKSYYYSHIAASQKSTAAVNVYYTDVVTHYNNDGPELFAGYDTYCISPAEMNYYHHNLCEKIESIEYWYSPQKVFTGICDVDNLLYTSKSGSYLVTSLVTASFGVKHTSTIEPGDILPMP